MLLSQIPIWGYVVAIVVLEGLAYLWYRSSVERGKKEQVSIKLEKITFISALVIGILGLGALVILSLTL